MGQKRLRRVERLCNASNCYAVYCKLHVKTRCKSIWAALELDWRWKLCHRKCGGPVDMGVRFMQRNVAELVCCACDRGGRLRRRTCRKETYAMAMSTSLCMSVVMHGVLVSLAAHPSFLGAQSMQHGDWDAMHCPTLPNDLYAIKCPAIGRGGACMLDEVSTHTLRTDNDVHLVLLARVRVAHHTSVTCDTNSMHYALPLISPVSTQYRVLFERDVESSDVYDIGYVSDACSSVWRMFMVSISCGLREVSLRKSPEFNILSGSLALCQVRILRFYPYSSPSFFVLSSNTLFLTISSGQ